MTLLNESISDAKGDEHLSDVIREIGRLFGRPYSEKELCQRVPSLTDDQRMGVVKSLSQFSQIIRMAYAERIPLNDDVRILEYWLEKMQFRIDFPAEQYIDYGNIVEVYDLDFIQLYRNHEFYKFCTYDPLTLATTPFPQLFKRDESINQILFNLIERCLKGKKIIPMDDPIHQMYESFSRDSRVYQIDHKYIAPVFKKQSLEPIAFFVTQKAKYIGDSNISGMGRVYDS